MIEFIVVLDQNPAWALLCRSNNLGNNVPISAMQRGTN